MFLKFIQRIDTCKNIGFNKFTRLTPLQTAIDRLLDGLFDDGWIAIWQFDDL